MDWLLPGVFGLVVMTLFVATIALVIVTLVDVVRMPNDASFKSGTQIVWVLVILLGGLIGAIVYLVVGRPPGGATAARQHPAVTAPPPPPPSGTV
jgi:phospholipase D-like protein